MNTGDVAAVGGSAGYAERTWFPDTGQYSIKSVNWYLRDLSFKGHLLEF